MPSASVIGPPHRTAPRCLVLGGTGYVGSAVCRLLTAHGARVAFTFHRNAAQAELLCAELPGSQRLPWDCTAPDPGAVVEDAAFGLGGFDVLIDCVGTAGDAALYAEAGLDDLDKFLRIDAAGWNEMLAVTACSAFLAAQAAARIMRHNGGGRMVFIGSMDGVKPVPAPVHYAAAKGALSAMTQALAKALGPHGILVNTVAPGILEGGVGRLLSDKLRADYLAHCALKRLGTAQDVAELAVWLACENTYVTGQTLLLDGGL